MNAEDPEIRARETVDRTVEALAGLGLTAVVRKLPGKLADQGADACLSIGKGAHQIDYIVEARTTLTPATVGGAIAKLHQVAAGTGRRPLLVAGHVTPPLAETLRGLDQQFADTAGNAYLNGPDLLVFVTGRKPAQQATAVRPARAVSTAGVKVLFALLCDHTLAQQPQRIIATAATVALGAVPAVLADLEQRGHLIALPKGRRLQATRRLLDEWALIYARTVRPKTLQTTYVTPRFRTWSDWNVHAPDVLWGGEPAANLLVKHLRPGILTLYTEKLPPRLLLELQAVPAGPLARDNLLEVRKPFWGTTPQPPARPDSVHPVLVYGDLLATGDGRCIETAAMVYDQHLVRLFPRI